MLARPLAPWPRTSSGCPVMALLQLLSSSRLALPRTLTGLSSLELGAYAAGSHLPARCPSIVALAC